MSLKRRIYKWLAVDSSRVCVGRNFQVGPLSRLWAPNRLEIGNDVYVGKFVTIEVDGEIGDGVLIANSVGIIGRRDHDHNQIGIAVRRARWVGTDKSLVSRVKIDSDVWIGYGSIILAPLTIGHSAIVAAGAVVINDVPPFAVVAGNPAQIISMRFSNEEERIEHWSKLREIDEH